MKNESISRRTILRGVGVSMALPMLESMIPAFGSRAFAEATEQISPKRFAAILLPFGVYSPSFHPQQEGRDYEMPEVLKVLEPHRNDMTVFSEIDHGVKGGHQACHTALSGITHAQAGAFPDGNVGLDQYLADHLAGRTRISSLCLGSSGRIGAGWTRAGVSVPVQATPLDGFNLLFLDKGPDARKQRAEFLASGKSILDAVNDSAKSFGRGLTSADKSKLDEYFTAVRETEVKLESSIKWLDESIPQPSQRAPKADRGNVQQYMSAWFDILRLAFETDSTRVATLSPMSGISPSLLDGVENEYHALSHHGRAEDRVSQLKMTEKFILSHLGRFYKELKSIKQVDGSSLLDSTTVLFTSGMGDGSSHTNTNVPVILAGGGYDHGQHLKIGYKQPLNNLYLSIANHFGVETDRFNTSSGTLNGLEIG